VRRPETEAILKARMLFRVNEALEEDYIRSVTKTVRSVARRYAA
jgi:hypothetical protein